MRERLWCSSGEACARILVSASLAASGLAALLLAGPVRGAPALGAILGGVLYGLGYTLGGPLLALVTLSMVALQAPSPVVDAGLVVAGLAILAGPPHPGGSVRALRIILRGLPFVLYAAALWYAVSMGGGGPYNQPLWGAPGRAILLALVGLLMVLTGVWTFYPGRPAPGIRALADFLRRHYTLPLELFTLAFVVMAARVDLVTLFGAFIGVGAYMWSRTTGAGRLGSLAAFVVVYTVFLYATGAAFRVDEYFSLLGR